MNDSVSDSDLAAARRLLEQNGHVVMTRKSYENAQRRQHYAQCEAESQRRNADSARSWAQDELCVEIRDLRSRCAFLYGEARVAGRTVEELRGESVGGRA